MPRTIPHAIKLFERDPNGSRLLETLDPARLDALAHSTRLPGGFFEARLAMPATERDFWEWRQSRMLCRLAIEESTARLVWEGRVEVVGMTEDWRLAIAARGYWSNLTDTVRNRSYSNGNADGRAIISGLIADMHPQTRQLSTATDLIERGPIIDHAYEDDWTIWRILTDRRSGVTAFGSGAGERMDIGVWEGRKLSYARRAPRGIDWVSYVKPENGGGVARMPLSADWRDVANAVRVAYRRNGARELASQAIDARSIARYIRRERHVPDIGESAAATATLRRDTELRSAREVSPRLARLELDRVWDASGVEWPLCRVRAGDVIRIPDFTPSSQDLDGVTLDAYRTFFIEETTCDHAAGTLIARPEAGGEIAM